MNNWWDQDPSVEEYANTHAMPDVPAIVPEEPSPLVKFGRGMADVVQGGKELALHATFNPKAQNYSDQVNAEVAQYEKGADEGYVDPWRIAGSAAALAPAAVMAGTTAIAGAGMGAVGALLTPAGEGAAPYWQKKGWQTTFGTVAGAVAPWVTRSGIDVVAFPIKKLRPYARKIWSGLGSKREEILGALESAAAKAGVSWGDLGEEAHASMVEDAVKRYSLTGEMDPDAVVRAQNFSRWGYEPLKGQITRTPKDWTDERELAKLDDIGAGLRDRLTGQNQQMTRNAKATADQFSPSDAPSIADESYRVGSTVKGVARDYAKQSQERVRGEYKAAAEAPGIGTRAADVNGLKSRLTTIYAKYGDQIPGGIKKRVEALVNSDSKHKNRLAPTVQNINETLQIVNARYGNAINPAERAGLGEVATELRTALDDVAIEGGEAAATLRSASKLAARRFGFIGRGRGDARDIVDDLIDGKTSSDKFLMTKVVNGDTDALDHLRRFLTVFPDDFGGTLDPTRGKAAWDGIRGGVIRWMESKAKPRAELGDTNAVFNGGQFFSAWQSLGPRRNVLFNQQEFEMIDSLARAARDLTVEPMGAYPNRSNTTPALINYLTKVSQYPLIGRVANNILEAKKTSAAFAEELAKRQAARAAMGEIVPEQPLIFPTKAFEGGRSPIGVLPGLGHFAGPAGGMLGSHFPQMFYQRGQEPHPNNVQP